MVKSNIGKSSFLSYIKRFFTTKDHIYEIYLKQEVVMMKEELEKRILEINQALEQSAAHHNALLGRLTEAQSWLKAIFEKECEDKKEVQDAII